MKLVLVLFLMSLNLLASEECVHTKNRFSCVTYISNYDGDTIRFKLPGIHPFFGARAQVRVIGIDTPELKAKRDAFPCEIEWGRVAKRLVEAELKSAKKIHITKLAGHDKYGRILGQVEYDGKILGEVLLRNHLAVPYLGKKKTKVNWCELKAKREKK